VTGPESARSLVFVVPFMIRVLLTLWAHKKVRV
jgi:hypothetical protein